MTRVDSLEKVASARRRLGNYVSGRRAYDYLKRITRYHRIQGSHGLQQAVEAVEALIVDEAPDLVEVTSYKYTGKSSPEWLQLPTAWDVYDATLTVNGRIYRLQAHPTLPAAHTPPTDGVVEGEVVPVRDPLDPREYEEKKDKIVLVTEYHRLAYRLAAEAGVAGVILAMKDRNWDAFPYIGLFLTSEEASKYATPAVTVPWRLAGELEGKRVRIRVDADIGGPGEVPVLIAWLGDPQAGGPSLVAHICHPKPGANDNASGVASSLEAFIALAEAIEAGDLEQPEGTLRLILVPEYTGSTLLLEGWMHNLHISGLNLDMVARSGTLADPPRLTYAPITVGPSRTADTYYDVLLAAGGDAGIDYYMAGSDHDVFIGYGRDSAMVNQWPDPYYHSDLDDADTIDPGLLASTALNAATTVYLEASGYEPTGLARMRVAERLASRAAASGGLTSLTAMVARLRYGAPLEALAPQWSPLRDDRTLRARQPYYTGLLSGSLSLEDKIAVARRLKELGIGYNVLNEAIFAAARGYTVSRLHTELAAAYPRLTSEDLFREVVGLLVEAGFIEAS